MEAELVKFEIKRMPALCVVGKAIVIDRKDVKTNNPIPGFWKKCFEEDIFGNIEKAMKGDIFDSSYVGFMKPLNEKEFVNVCGILIYADVPVPDEYDSYNIDPFTAGVGWVKGKEPDIYMIEHKLTAQEIEKAGYECNKDDFVIELYNESRFTSDSEENKIIDYYIPCRERTN